MSTSLQRTLAKIQDQPWCRTAAVCERIRSCRTYADVPEALSIHLAWPPVVACAQMSTIKGLLSLVNGATDKNVSVCLGNHNGT